MNSNKLSEVFEYFKTTEFINKVSNASPLKVTSLFHDEDIVSDALLKAHFGRRYNIVINEKHGLGIYIYVRYLWQMIRISIM